MTTIDTTTTPIPQLLTVPEVMAALRLKRSAVYNLIRSGRLPSLRIGAARRIPASALSTYVDNQLREAC